jgi:hypothetical protein
LLYTCTKFDYNMSFRTLVIVQKLQHWPTDVCFIVNYIIQQKFLPVLHLVGRDEVQVSGEVSPSCHAITVQGVVGELIPVKYTNNYIHHNKSILHETLLIHTVIYICHKLGVNQQFKLFMTKVLNKNKNVTKNI